MIFITGSNGFVGKALTSFLLERKLDLISGCRELYGDMQKVESWEKFLTGVDVVVHLAARVHVMEESSEDPLNEFRKANVEVTKKLALSAKKMGVKKFIYLSSIKVNGELSYEKPFTASDLPNPLDPYGVSKLEAEQELLSLNTENFQVIIIRPPLVYGVGVKANFERLFWLVKNDLPIPFKAAFNKRSLVSVLNLSDLIYQSIINDQYLGGNIFLVSDGRDFSLNELIIEMGKVVNKTPHLIYIPLIFFKIFCKIFKKQSYYDRLFENLQVDISHTQKTLKWTPPFDFQQTFNIK